MKKKLVLFFVLIMMIVGVVVNFSMAGAEDSVVFSSKEEGVVKKTSGNAFTVTITFQNTGNAEGSWSVNVVFEGDSWSWKGTAKTLTLDANEKKTLTWNGVMPANATVNSVARLVVYYDDSFEALDWWIQVVPAAELTIKSSSIT
ncbi:hypothetical protein E2P42_02130 [Candidatus Bathyarchaeota archaeon]|nr:hypothetical protein E2P42_02130 [Candidatus Bathyarchaeota archaeon]